MDKIKNLIVNLLVWIINHIDKSILIETNHSETAINLCKFIDSYAMKNLSYNEKLNLWYILTALRGPDNEDANIKLTSTAITRGFTFPNLARISGASMGMEKEMLIKHYSLFEKRGFTDHFANHIRLAVQGIPALRDQFFNNTPYNYEPTTSKKS